MAGSVVAQELEILGKFIKNLGDGARTDSGYDGEINIYWDTVNLVVRMQVYSATKGDWEAFDPTGYPHASRHSVTGDDTVTVENLATAGAVGTAPVSDGFGVVAMTSVTTEQELTDHIETPTAHHSNASDHLEAHTVESTGTHAESGLTVGHVLRASGATAFGFAELQSGDINGDQLVIDWNPTSYVPVATPTEVSSVDHLTAHLYGIDQALGGAVASGVVQGFDNFGKATGYLFEGRVHDDVSDSYITTLKDLGWFFGSGVTTSNPSIGAETAFQATIEGDIASIRAPLTALGWISPLIIGGYLNIKSAAAYLGTTPTMITVEILASVNATTANANQSFGVFHRGSSPTFGMGTGDVIGVRLNSTTKWQYVGSGVGTPVAGTATRDTNPHLFRFEIEAEEIRAYVDGVLDYTDSTVSDADNFPAGIGVWSQINSIVIKIGYIKVEYS